LGRQHREAARPKEAGEYFFEHFIGKKGKNRLRAQPLSDDWATDKGVSRFFQ
jgi:hypothetical protein